MQRPQSATIAGLPRRPKSALVRSSSSRARPGSAAERPRKPRPRPQSAHTSRDGGHGARPNSQSSFRQSSSVPRATSATFAASIGRDASSKPRLQRQKSAPGGVQRRPLRRATSVESVSASWFRSGTHGHNLVMPNQMSSIIQEHRPDIKERADHDVAVMENKADPDEQRTELKAIKIKQDEAYEKWMSSYRRKLEAKAKQEEAEAVAMVAVLERKTTQQKDANFAYRRWMSQKEDAKKLAAEAKDAEEARMARYRSLPHTRSAVEKHCRDNELFAMVDAFMIECASKKFDGIKHVGIAEVEGMLSAALIQTKVMERIVILEQQSNIEEQKRKSKEEKVKDRVRMKIGQQILATLSTGRQLFGAVINNVQDVFNAADKNGDHILQKEEFREVLVRLDLGLTTPQLQDLWSTFDVDNSGGIDYNEFEDILISVEAQAQIDAPPKPPSKRMRMADSVIMKLGGPLANKLFNKVFGTADDLRRSEKHSGIGLWDFRAGMRKLPFKTVNVVQKNNFLKCFERLFKILDRKKTNIIQPNGVVFFIRKLCLELQDEQNAAAWRDVDPDEQDSNRSGPKESTNSIKYRLGILILRNLEGQLPGKTVDNLILFATNAFRTLDVDNTGRLTKQQFLTAIREMGFGLTLSQEYQLMEAIDTDFSNTITIQEFVQFLWDVHNKRAQDKLQKAERNDPTSTSSVISMMVNGVTNDVAILVPMLDDVKEVLRQITEEGRIPQQVDLDWRDKDVQIDVPESLRRRPSKDGAE